MIILYFRNQGKVVLESKSLIRLGNDYYIMIFNVSYAMSFFFLAKKWKLLFFRLINVAGSLKIEFCI